MVPLQTLLPPQGLVPTTTVPPVCNCATRAQTRVDRVNIDNSLAMERLFGAPGWEAQLQQQR